MNLVRRRPPARFLLAEPPRETLQAFSGQSRRRALGRPGELPRLAGVSLEETLSRPLAQPMGLRRQIPSKTTDRRRTASRASSIGSARRRPGYPKAQEEVFENVRVARHRPPLDLALAGDVREIHRLAMGEADGVEEAREISDVSNPPFDPHFLIDKERCVGAQNVPRVGSIDDQWYETSLERRVESERGNSAAMNGWRVRTTPLCGTPGRQIDSASYELSRAGIRIQGNPSLRLRVAPTSSMRISFTILGTSLGSNVAWWR